jgi:hypothetical protein
MHVTACIAFFSDLGIGSNLLSISTFFAFMLIAVVWHSVTDLPASATTGGKRRCGATDSSSTVGERRHGGVC